MRRVSIAVVNDEGVDERVAAPIDGLMWLGVVVNSHA